MKQVINGLTRFEANPSAFMTRHYDKETKDALIKYMESFEASSAAGLVDDCKTGETVMMTNVGFEDGEFIWSTQDIYHLKKYNAAVSDDFILHVMKSA